MEIKEIPQEGFTTLAPIGELDANSSIQMDEKIREVVNKGVFHIHMDFGGLEYISSAGLGVFVSFLEELRNGGGKFVFTGMTDNIFKVFQLLGLHQVMTIVSTDEEVIDAFKA